MANVLMNDIIFGTTVVGMIYNIEYDNDTANALIQKEFGQTLEKVRNATLNKLELWTNHPIEDLEKNVKQLWNQVKTSDSATIASHFKQTLSTMFPQYKVLIEVWN